MTDKQLKPYGVASLEFNDPELAAGYTYTTRDGRLFSTPLIFPDNPFNDLVKNAKYILDIGCGVGRNLAWILENTEAVYVGLDPNESMLKYFWNYNNARGYEDRVHLFQSFSGSPTGYDIENIIGGNGIKFDVVVSTFVFQHIGFRPPAGEMNVADITNAVAPYAHDDTVWILYEHDWEEQWIGEWMNQTGLFPAVYKRDYTGIEELTHRAPHHLIISKGVPGE